MPLLFATGGISPGRVLPGVIPSWFSGVGLQFGVNQTVGVLFSSRRSFAATKSMTVAFGSRFQVSPV